MNDEPLRLLIDSCLTPTAVPRLLAAFGARIDAVHADRVLPLGTPDVAVMDWAGAEQRLLITANSADFLALLRDRSKHPGVGLVIDQNTRARQVRAVERLAGALLRRAAAGGILSERVFIWTRANRLIVRRTR